MTDDMLGKLGAGVSVVGFASLLWRMKGAARRRAALRPPIVSYYLDLAGVTSGPFLRGQLRELFRSGAITPETLYAEPGAAEWRPIAVLLPKLLGGGGAGGGPGAGGTGAGVRRVGRTAGAGLGWMLLGLVCFGVGLLGVLTLIQPAVLWPLGGWLVYHGVRGSTWLVCAECGGQIAMATARTCPHCQADLA